MASNFGNHLRATLAVLALTLFGVAFAQDGVSTGGAARTRYLGNRAIYPSAQEVVVEDFVNYHRHEIGRPKAGEAVGLDLRWSQDGNRPILQVGLSTALANDRAQLRPVNLSLVIDKSGSMAVADKLVRVKQAMQTLVSHLRDKDTLSIVVFDSDAEVLLPSQPVRNRQKIREAIDSIEPGSATNLNAGLMLGYQEAAKHYQRSATNRVILLTDGITNHGVVDSAKIAASSLGYNDQGIDLSTIGVGQDLNEELLRRLAKSGHGLYHFVADAQDIDKVFAKEVQSLLSPVAIEPSLHIDFGSDLDLERVYGYDPKLSGHAIDIKLDNLNGGATEVVLLRFKPAADREETPRVKVNLSYHDLDRDKAIAKSEVVSPAHAEDSSVTKNYTIALLAQSIHDMASACQNGRTQEAQHYLDAAIGQARREYPNLEDEDIKRTLTMAEKYQGLLRQQNQDSEDANLSGENLLANGDFALGKRGFVSDLPYVVPSENCLWEIGYTIAPQWNAPLLHRLFSPAEYGAAKKPHGDEQVFYANMGGTQATTVWSAGVTCRAHTRYRIRFQSLCLNGEPEWIPNFVIKANGSRSPNQPAGFGKYRTVEFIWDSKGATSVTLDIAKAASDHDGGLVAISNIEMVPVLDIVRD